jgi:rifampicin phosphotransferase
MQYVKHLSELKRTDLPIAGGKGANLGALIQAGLPVPGGFVITTEGYRDYVSANHLETDIQRIITAIQKDDPVSLDSASEQIQACFRSGEIPADLKKEICLAYFEQNSQPQAVAVRSSATAEDLPDLSFAGQQDTYLNIIGESSLLDAVVRCWASLWTARAIGYRSRNAISHNDVALAVVVQQMVQSEASGVLFTANPLTGKRSETVIDATLGLGEALVSGQVEPDHYVVDSTGGIILSKTLGAKALSIQAQAGGGTVSLQNSAADRQALPDEQIINLAQLGQQAAVSFGSPQDMEWAWADDNLFVVQSRPVTSLYPLPPKPDDHTLEILLSFGVWQGMLDPYTPLGQDVFRYLVVGFARKFGSSMTAEKQRVMLTAGERIFVNLTYLLRSPFGRNIAQIFLSAIDPETAKIIAELLKDARFSGFEHPTMQERLDFLRVFFPLARRVLYNITSPIRGRVRLENDIESLLETIRLRYAEVKNLTDLTQVFEELTATMPSIMIPILVGAIAAGQAPYQILLRRLDFPGSQDLLFDLTRGLPHNVTTQMDLQLWETAREIKADETATKQFLSADTQTLVADYWKGKLPKASQVAIEKFLAQYGIRGVAEIDMGRQRWCENPSNLFQALKSYLQIDPSAAPDVMFRKGTEIAVKAEEQIVAAVRRQPGGFLTAGLVKGMIRRFRELGGLRESPKFFVVRLLSIYRYALLAEGEKLAAVGTFARADDVMFLHLWELKALGEGEPRDWKALITERRSAYERELRRKRIPRILLSDGTAYYDAPAALTTNDPNVLTGTPVSAGVVEGKVRVVFDPHGVQVLPGEILVCPATDPAWTPLFLAAGGLITEVGGMMTHGSVVAREYGIPAVVGVSQATVRLQTGQLVRVDGSNGTVEILE